MRTSSLAAERGETARIQIVGPLARALVPRLAGLGVAEAGAGVEDHQRARHRRMDAVERQRHVAAQRQSADHRALHAAGAQDGGHVLDSGGLGIGGRIGRIVALAVTAHVPHDHLVAVAQRGDLAVPHAAGRAVAVRQQDGGPWPCTS